MIDKLLKAARDVTINAELIYAEIQLEKLQSSNNEQLKQELEKHISELKAKLCL